MVPTANVSDTTWFVLVPTWTGQDVIHNGKFEIVQLSLTVYTTELEHYH